MGAQRRRARSGRAGRHRRTGSPLLERREHGSARERGFTLPAPAPSALVGIAVLVLIGFGVIHLSSTGSAVPLEEHTRAVEAPAPGLAGAGPADVDPDGAEGPSPAGSPAGPAADPGGEADVGGEDGLPGSPGAPEGTDAEPEQPRELVVHVSGAVGDPGVVRLPPGSRVDDAVLAAGGATAEAELAGVNLARAVADGEQIHVPVPGEEVHVPAAPQPPGGSDAAEGTDAPSGGSDGTGGPIDLNTADATRLEELPGVGPAIAQRIIDHREKNGPFRSVDDLLEVSGIGPATLEKIRDQTTVSP